MGKSGKKTQQNIRLDVNSGKAEQVDEMLYDGKHLVKWAKWIYIAALVAVGLLLEKCRRFEVFQYTIIWWLYVTASATIGAGVVHEIKNIYKSDKRLSKPRPPKVKLGEDINCKLSLLLKHVFRNTTIAMLGLAFLWLTCVSVWGQFYVGARCSCAMKSFMEYEQNLMEDDVSQTPESNPSREEEADLANQEVATEAVQQTEMEEQQAKHIQQERNVLEISELEKKAQRMIFVQPVKEWSISSEERDWLLFKTGNYAIEDLTDPQAKEILEIFIAYLENQKKENQFDSLAAQDLKDKVAKVSDMDAELRTSEEKDKIITCRLDAYDIYEKESLASLLAEDFHCYALAYKNVGGDYDIIVSYYLQSLKWLYERLKYKDLSQKTQKDILRSIGYRYNDIMTYSEPGTDQWNRAKLLAELFKEMA